MTNIKYPTPADALAYAENTGRANVLPVGWMMKVNKCVSIEIELYYGEYLMAVAYSDHLVRFRNLDSVQCKSFDEAMGQIVHHAWEMMP